MNTQPLYRILFGFSVMLIFPTLSLAQGSAGVYVQQKKARMGLKDNVKALSLNDAIEQGLRENYSEEQREKEKEIVEIDWKDTKDSFWLPQFTLSLTTTEQRIGTLRRGSKNPTATPYTPSGALGISMADYTVFNWGKDYLNYLNNRSDYRRSRDSFDEKRRELKHDIITKFFEINMYKEILKVRKEQLRHASFVYRYNREKVSIKKTTKQDYYQSRMAYLKAQSDFHQAKNNLALTEEAMAYLIADDPGTHYILSEDLLYTKLKLKFDEALNISKNNNPTILDADKNLQNAIRDYEVTLKENLPLPKFTVGVGAYQKVFGRSTSHTTHFGDSNIDLVATINATWALTGTGGFLNGRKTRKSRLSQQLTQARLHQTKKQVSSELRNHYNNLQYLENQLTILTARTENMQKTFDVVLENYINRRTRFTHFNEALNEMIDSEILFQQNRFFHLREKILMASKIGIEDFPGENFEKLAIKRKEGL